MKIFVSRYGRWFSDAPADRPTCKPVVCSQPSISHGSLATGDTVRSDRDSINIVMIVVVMMMMMMMMVRMRMRMTMRIRVMMIITIINMMMMIKMTMLELSPLGTRPGGRRWWCVTRATS